MLHSSHKIEKITGRPQTLTFRSSLYHIGINPVTSEKRRFNCRIKLGSVWHDTTRHFGSWPFWWCSQYASLVFKGFQVQSWPLTVILKIVGCKFNENQSQDESWDDSSSAVCVNTHMPQTIDSARHSCVMSEAFGGSGNSLLLLVQLRTAFDFFIFCDLRN
jgi:hypothetical protein